MASVLLTEKQREREVCQSLGYTDRDPGTRNLVQVTSLQSDFRNRKWSEESEKKRGNGNKGKRKCLDCYGAPCCWGSFEEPCEICLKLCVWRMRGWLFILSTSSHRLKAAHRVFPAALGQGLKEPLLLQRKPWGRKVEHTLCALAGTWTDSVHSRSHHYSQRRAEGLWPGEPKTSTAPERNIKEILCQML